MGKTLSEGRKVGSGRPKGVANKPKNKKRPKVVLEVIEMDNNVFYGTQVKPLRKLFGYTMKELADLADMDFTNIGHFENKTAGYKGAETVLPKNLTKYLKALGIKEVILKL
jgi:hypothetical protein